MMSLEEKKMKNTVSLLALSLFAGSCLPGYSAESALGTVGEGVGAVGRGVGQGVGAVGRGVGRGVGAVGRGVTKLPGLNLLFNESEGVMVGNARMLPARDMVQNLKASNLHTDFVTAINQSNMAALLSSLQNGPYTVFAPTNQAFNKLPQDRVESLLSSTNNTELTRILNYHIVPGMITSRYLRDGQTLTTVNGEKLYVTIQNNQISINGARVIIPNAVSNNGIIHVVDSVITPTGSTTRTSSTEIL